MPGPLANVDTLIAGINNDIGRLLYFQDPASAPLTIKFLRPDSTEVSGFELLLTLVDGFDMLTPDETVGKPGQSVVFSVADKANQLTTIIRAKDLHVEVNNVIYKVGPVPLVPANEGQVYTLTCTIRNPRAVPFDPTHGN